MESNPFTSSPFTTIWLREFNSDNSSAGFPSIEGLAFVKHRILPLYYNVGKTLTKGINYRFLAPVKNELANKVLLIYDVPSYTATNDFQPSSGLNLKKIKQYPGFAINLEDFEDLEDYMTKTFGRSSRYKLRRYKRNIERDLDIQYRAFYGHITEEEYRAIFAKFRALLVKRFEQKKIRNNNLEEEEWNFYEKVAMPMIHEKKAMLFAVYKEDDPIAITLNYCSNDIFYNGITVFDTDYSDYRVGSTSNLKLIEWCYENQFRIFDFSKGLFEYKQRWSNLGYHFDYHIIYDSSSITSSLLARFLLQFLKLKQFLREKELNTLLHRLRFFVNNKLKKKK